jgi:hypothetical protein
MRWVNSRTAELPGCSAEDGVARVEALGFGWGQASVLYTPIIWLTLSAAAQQFGVRIGDGATTGAKRLLRKLLRKKDRPVPPLVVPLTTEQLTRVREIAIRVCRRRKISDARATEIANEIVTALVTAYPTDDGSGK